MKVIVVDDNQLIMKMEEELLRACPLAEEVHGFCIPEEALDFLRNNAVDAAFLDIEMNGVDGLTLARQMKQIRESCAIVFLTGHSEYAVEAFHLHASGFLVKPVTVQALNAEMDYIMHSRRCPARTAAKTTVSIHTFGRFYVEVNGVPLHFARAKSRELMAYLVDLRGRGCAKREISKALWGDDLYDRSRQQQLQVVISSMMKTLRDADADWIILRQRNCLAINREQVDCDLYRFIGWDQKTVEIYRGQYLVEFPWAQLEEENLSAQ